MARLRESWSSCLHHPKLQLSPSPAHFLGLPGGQLNMIISRAAAAELLVLTAGLGKGHVQPGARCIPWGHRHGGSPGCCPGWHPAETVEADRTGLPECGSPAGRLSSSLLFPVRHPLHVGNPGDGRTPKLALAPRRPHLQDQSMPQLGPCPGSACSSSSTARHQGLCLGGGWDRVPREMAPKQWRI